MSLSYTVHTKRLINWKSLV